MSVNQINLLSIYILYKILCNKFKINRSVRLYYEKKNQRYNNILKTFLRFAFYIYFEKQLISLFCKQTKKKWKKNLYFTHDFNWNPLDIFSSGRFAFNVFFHVEYIHNSFESMRLHYFTADIVNLFDDSKNRAWG